MDLLIAKETGERIDTRLTSKFGYSRNFFHHIISRGGILVNDKPVKKSYVIKKEDKIFIDDLKRFMGSEVLSEAPDIDIPIVLEKEDYLVINKPKGVLSHPNSVWEVKQPSVVGFLYHRYKNLPSVGHFIRAGLIHRLDKDTNGLMLIAKTEKGLSHFKSLFQQKSESETIEKKESALLKKFYRATCHVLPEGKIFLDSIKDFPYYIQEPVIAKVPNCQIKEGITKIMKYGFLEDQKLISIELEILTGRTHQIRYHLANHGLPIVGDYLYGIDKIGPVQLTAWRLEFEDIDGEIKILSI